MGQRLICPSGTRVTRDNGHWRSKDRSRPGRFEFAHRFRVSLFSLPMRAFLLATSAGQRARLMLPTGVLSGVEFPVTSKYVGSLASNDNCEFLRRASLATVW